MGKKENRFGELVRDSMPDENYLLNTKNSNARCRQKKSAQGGKALERVRKKKDTHHKFPSDQSTSTSDRPRGERHPRVRNSFDL